MGTRSYIQLCVRNKDGTITVYALIYSQYDGCYEGLGIRLASFLVDAVIVNGYGMLPNSREFNGPDDLFARTIVWLKKSCENIGQSYLKPPNTPCKRDLYIEYIYRVIVDEKTEKIIFEAEGGEIEENDGTVKQDNFSGEASDFLLKYASKDGSDLYKRIPLYYDNKNELCSNRKKLFTKIRELIDSMEKKKDFGYYCSRDRDELVALLDALVYPH